MKKKQKIKNPYNLTFKDALNAAIYLVNQKHLSEKPCLDCTKTLELLKEIKKRLNDLAISTNLVWYAHKGERKMDVK